MLPVKQNINQRKMSSFDIVVSISEVILEVNNWIDWLQ